MKKLMIVVLGSTCMAGIAVAGQIDSPGAPGSVASKMPAVGDIYNYLTTGTPVPTPGAGFAEPASGPASTGHTLTEIYAAVATPFPQCDAAAADVKSGKKFFCAVAGSWGVQTGTMSSGAGLLKTGQTSVYQTGDDGSYQKGQAFAYTSATDTTTDNVTGLMWAKNGTGAGCYGGSDSLVWSSAIVWAEALSFAGYTDWRLPNVTELQSLFVRENGALGGPYINRTFFPNTVSGRYWASTTCIYNSAKGYRVHFDTGDISSDAGKTPYGYYVRAVRGGQ